MSKKLFLSVLLCFILSANLLAADIKIAGGAAPMNNIFKKIKTDFEKKSGHKLILIEQSPELALQALGKGEVQIAAAGLKLDEWLNLCKDKHITVDQTKPLNQVQIGRDSIQVFVNKNLPLKQLSSEQLSKIFTGKSANWKEFGEADKPIKVVIGKGIAGTNKTFAKIIMNDAEFKNDATVVESAEDVISAIGKNDNAIGFGPAGLTPEKHGARTLNAPDIFRSIYMVSTSSDKFIADLKAFISSPEGRALINK